MVETQYKNIKWKISEIKNSWLAAIVSNPLISHTNPDHPSSILPGKWILPLSHVPCPLVAQPSQWSDGPSWYCSACVQRTLISLNGDADNSHMPKRSCKVFSLSGNVKVLHLWRKKKKSCAEVAKVYGKNKSFIHEIVKKEKEICASFAVVFQTEKVIAIVND